MIVFVGFGGKIIAFGHCTLGELMTTIQIPKFSAREMFPYSKKVDSPSSFTLHVMWKPLVIR